MGWNREGDHDDEFEKFRRLFMRELPGTGGEEAVDLDGIKDEDIELFEQMMRDLILPHLMVGGVPGVIQDMKIIRLGGEQQRKEKDPDADLSWLDKYL